MEVKFRYGKEKIVLRVPEDSSVYKSGYQESDKSVADLLLDSILNPFGCLPLKHYLKIGIIF